MERANENGRASPVVILASLGAAGLFDALTALATQDKSVRAVSPWQDAQWASNRDLPVLASVDSV